MSYRLPLSVKEKLDGYELVDAAGYIIAAAPAYPWHGVPLEKQRDFVLENLTLLAKVANGDH